MLSVTILILSAILPIISSDAVGLVCLRFFFGATSFVSVIFNDVLVDDFLFVLKSLSLLWFKIFWRRCDSVRSSLLLKVATILLFAAMISTYSGLILIIS